MPTVLLTGANRGVGAVFLRQFREKGYTVIAAVRDPSKMKQEDGVIVVKIDAASTTDAREAVEELQSKHKIDHIDILVANAALNKYEDPFATLDPAKLMETLEVNVRGPLILFQAVLPLLKPGAKVCLISSGRGTINQQHRAYEGAYGMSKAALNYLAAKLQCEHEDLVVWAQNPGWLKTYTLFNTKSEDPADQKDSDMGNQGARWAGMKEAPLDADHTASSMIEIMEEATREKYGGKMVSW